MLFSLTYLFCLTDACFFESNIFLEICAQMVSTDAQLEGHV